MRVGTDILIRPLTAADRDQLSSILRATGVFSAEEVGVALELIDIALADADQKDYLIRSADGDDGRVLGYYCIGPTPMTAGTYDLYWIAVDPATQNTGVGRALIAHAEELAASRGCTLLIAETSTKPSYEGTHRFYHRAGYEELSRIGGYYAPGDDLVIYGKYLTQ